MGKKNFDTLSLACRFLESKLILFLIEYPFSSKKDIQKKNHINIPKNWEDVKNSLDRLVEKRIIWRVHNWHISQYFVYELLDSLEHSPTANFLRLKEIVMSLIENTEKIRNCKLCKKFKQHYSINDLRNISKSKFQKIRFIKYHFDIDENVDVREQILFKFLNLYYVKVKTYLSEKKKILHMDESYIKRKKWYYHDELYSLFDDMRRFLENYDGKPETWNFSFPELNDFVNHLDTEYEWDLLYYQNLKSKRSWAERVKIAKVCAVVTKKQVSEDLKILMKSVTKIIAPLMRKGVPDSDIADHLAIDQNLDNGKIHYLPRKEEGTHQILSSETYDEEVLNYADEERALLKEVKGKSEREKIEKIFKSVFGEELIGV